MDMLTKPEYQSLIGQSPSGDDSRLPPAIQAIKPFWLSVNSNDVLIMKSGGHYHMGLIFQPTATDPSRYELVFREERDLNHDTFLFSLAKR